MFAPTDQDLQRGRRRLKPTLVGDRRLTVHANLAVIGAIADMANYNDIGHTLNGDYPAMVANWDANTNMIWLTQQVNNGRTVHVHMTSDAMINLVSNPINRNRRFTLGAETLAFLTAGYYLENARDGMILRPSVNILGQEFNRILIDFNNLGNHNNPAHGNSFWNKHRHRLIAFLNG